MDGLTKLCRHLKTIKLPDGMTRERLSALAAITANAPVSVTTLAAIENVRPPTMSRMVASLVEDGLAKRSDHKTDGRGVLISMTPKGRRVYRRATELSLHHLNSALSQLSEDELKAIDGLSVALDSLQDKRPTHVS